MVFSCLVLIKFIIGFFIVIVHLNISGKTQLSQMTPVDFIGNFVLGGIIGGVIYTQAIPLYEYILVLLIGVCLISALNYISKHVYLLRNFTIGEPIPIIKNSNFLMNNILKKKNKIDIINIISQLHSQGIYSFEEVYYAQIEPNGQLTVICDPSKMPSVILIKEGTLRTNELEHIKKNEYWLMMQIAQFNLDLEDIFIAEFWNKKLRFILNDGSVHERMI
ncbi:DUF421 domain-containing protein [Acinetobacter nectaris]|uniref:DUF421 domain-containing protein n=1 Tax=Acinetobacter nectaris TaxID=1219382 RepID=UPI001F3A4082|nr:YetF domain-containing protein [Acinetobacter nectaris]MCF8999319.1 DUF421 domain-containing protein [Acinetobacter nectaris]MCF9028074.1 DUF421 domain-containing protein [Acinetobacter nectaris]